MKYTLSFSAGALLVTIAILTAGGRPAGMFLVGGLTAIILGFAIAWAVGIARLCRFLMAFDSAYNCRRPETVHGVDGVAGFTRAPSPSRAATPGRRKNHTVSRTNVVSFQKRTVLSTVQQDVVSALVNQGMAFNRAQGLVLEASAGRPEIDFDTLFRSCISAPRAANA
jgi:hypothetical protein